MRGFAGPTIERKLEESLGETRLNSLNLISKLTHHGTRSFIDFLGALRIDFRTQYDLVLRLFEEQPHNLLRLYITNLNKRFAQFANHFPNLFLVDAVVAPTERFKSLHTSHIHTYWLKYLLLRYIVSKHEKSEITTYNELKEIFVDSCKYEENIFDLALGSLNAVNSFRCIEVDEDSIGLGDCLRLKPTTRGITIVSSVGGDIHSESQFCFDFNYLQFVVDDPQLSIPKDHAKLVYVETDIGYMLSSAPAYRAGLASYLVQKSQAVLHFTHILKHSADFERNLRLKNEPAISKLLPNFDNVFRNLLAAFSSILLTHVPHGLDTFSSLRERHKQLLGDTQMPEFFGNYAVTLQSVEPS